jgi:hypothetical protein
VVAVEVYAEVQRNSAEVLRDLLQVIEEEAMCF